MSPLRARIVVEREGLSVRHPAKFVLIGSGNPEEGELRPQLLRSGSALSVEVRSPRDIEVRIAIMPPCRRERARIRKVSAARWAGEDEKDPERVARGKAAAAQAGNRRGRACAMPPNCAWRWARTGLRGELTLMRAARALAALDGAKAVTRKHLIEIAPFGPAPQVAARCARRNRLDRAYHPGRIDELFGMNADEAADLKADPLGGCAVRGPPVRPRTAAVPRDGAARQQPPHAMRWWRRWPKRSRCGGCRAMSMTNGCWAGSIWPPAFPPANRSAKAG